MCGVDSPPRGHIPGEEAIAQEDSGNMCKSMHAYIHVHSFIPHIYTHQAIILVQSHFRRHIAQRSFDNYRRSKLRTLVLELVTLPPRVVENGLVVFSALDTFTNSQLMRVDKKGDVALRESFLIPGVTTQMTLYLTLAVKDEGAAGNSPLQYSIILQGQVRLTCDMYVMEEV